MSELRDMIAAAIHESRPGATKWENLPPSPQNPERYYAYQATDGVIKLFSPGAHDPEDVKAVVSAAADSLGEEARGALCGKMTLDQRGSIACTYMKDHEGKHTWE